MFLVYPYRLADLHKLVKDELKHDEVLTLPEKCAKIENLLDNISDSDRTEIEKLTIEQNESNMWHKARYCHITASRCHEVMTRMKTLEKDKTQNAENLLKRLLYSKNICTSAMEKGRKWEDDAFNKYKVVMEREQHKNLSVLKSGLVISENVMLGASPDGLISCECHGQGVLEIKSATKFEDKDPNTKEVIEKIPYLERNGTDMKKNHKYYSQIQFQMGITGRSWCHLVVFTPKCLEENVNPLIVQVKFDKAWFERLVNTSMKFWYQHLLPEIIEKKLCTENTKGGKDVLKNQDHEYALSSEGSNLFEVIVQYVMQYVKMRKKLVDSMKEV